ncbi:Fic family protein [Candidatus Gracilibacteria bacterium]|nr:Fic family protein [Candidatus Gracilibacteria bacterium]
MIFVTDDFFIDSILLGELDEMCSSILEKYVIANCGNITNNSIHNRLMKYRDRISEDYKVRKEKHKDEIFNTWETEIIQYLSVSEKNTPGFTQEYIQGLHKLLFPKGVRAKCLSGAGQWYYEIHQAGTWRKNQMWTTVGGIDYSYINSSEVESAMKLLAEWQEATDKISILTRTIFSYFIFCEIHPFSDGNGTVALLIVNTILRSHNIAIDWIDIYSRWTPEVQLQIFKSVRSSDYKATIQLIEKHSTELF